MEQILVNEGMPYLPEEIITNILKHLPVKSLKRFQSVCKRWKNLFKTPSFIQHHLHYSTHRNSSLLIQQVHEDEPFCLRLFDYCNMRFHEVARPPLFDSLLCLSIVGSTNGLICLADHSISPPAPLLWNPATREVRRVPITYDDFPVSWHFGFGFSPIINDYKIVRFSELDMVYGVEVYSLTMGSWRCIQFDIIKDVCIRGNGVTVNGKMFWYGVKLGADIMGADDTCVIVSFDMVSEVFTLIPSPSILRYSSQVKLAVYEDKLAIISYHRTKRPLYSLVFLGVMEDGVIGSSGDGWRSDGRFVRDSHPFKIHVETIWRNRIACIDFEVETECDEREEDVEPTLGLYLINITTDKREVFTILRHAHDYGVGVINYMESLVPVGNI